MSGTTVTLILKSKKEKKTHLYHAEVSTSSNPPLCDGRKMKFTGKMESTRCASSTHELLFDASPFIVLPLAPK
jgi:hypothetical protein